MPHALHFLVLTVAGWMNRHQEDLIDYLREENRVLREQLGRRPLRLTDAQRRRLAVRGKKLGRRVLTQVAGIVTRRDPRTGRRRQFPKPESEVVHHRGPVTENRPSGALGPHSAAAGARLRPVTRSTLIAGGFAALGAAVVAAARRVARTAQRASLRDRAAAPRASAAPSQHPEACARACVRLQSRAAHAAVDRRRHPAQPARPCGGRLYRADRPPGRAMGNV